MAKAEATDAGSEPGDGRPRQPDIADLAAENAALLALTRALASDPGSVFEHLAGAAIDLTTATAAGVVFCDRSNRTGALREAAFAGQRAPLAQAPLIERACRQALDGGEAFFLRAASTASEGAFQRGALGAADRLFVPIPALSDTSEDGAVGVLWVGGSTMRDGFDAEDARRLTGLTDFAAAAHRIVQGSERSSDAIAPAESQDRYRTLLDSIDEGFCIIELIFDDEDKPLDYILIEANASFERQTGLSDVIGRSIREMVPETEQFWFDTYGRIALTGDPIRLEAHANSLGHWYDLYAFRIGDPGQRRVAVLFNDIAERKRAEAAIHANEEQFRKFGEATSNILWIRDAETLNLRFVTSAYRRIYGIEPESPALSNGFEDWLALVLPEDRQKARENVEAVRQGNSVSFVHRIHRASDDTVRWLRNTDFPILNEAGGVTLIGGISEDMTERLEAERRLETLVQGIPQLVWRTDRNGNGTWCNPQWTKFTGLSQAQSAGSGWQAALHPEDRDTALAFWKKAEAAGHLVREERFRGHADGQYRWFQTRASPVRDADGTILEWLGTSTDIDDLLRLQERQKGLVAELQHRTRNLLGVIRSIADKTLQSSTSLGDFKARFKNRLGALSRVQSLLSRLNEQDRVTFDQLIRVELAAVHGGTDRVTLSGPCNVRLRSVTVQTLALALHELATNAMKYGALGQPNAVLDVTWRYEPAADADKPWLHVVWDESHVVMPQTADGTLGIGQGRELIERALPYQFGAKTRYEIKPDGIRCTIALPVSREH